MHSGGQLTMCPPHDDRQGTMDLQLPPGFRFHPTDEELVTHYLCRKVSDAGFRPRAVAEVDLNKVEPWDLPWKATMGEKEWYFFCVRDRKYPTGLRTNRATESGYWKATGKDREVRRDGTGAVLVGMKKTLVFYRGRAPKGEKTGWVMHEYRIEGRSNHQASSSSFLYNHPHGSRSAKNDWVLCRVFEKSPEGIKRPQGPESPNSWSCPAPNFNTNLMPPPLLPDSPSDSATPATGPTYHVPCFSNNNNNNSAYLGTALLQTGRDVHNNSPNDGYGGSMRLFSMPDSGMMATRPGQFAGPSTGTQQQQASNIFSPLLTGGNGLQRRLFAGEEYSTGPMVGVDDDCFWNF